MHLWLQELHPCMEDLQVESGGAAGASAAFDVTTDDADVGVGWC